MCKIFCKNNFVIIVSITFTACCSISATRISQRKCEEYAEFVNRMEAAPVLGLDEEIIQVSLCGIVETPLIVGGTKAHSKEFPHMVAIGFGRVPSGFQANEIKVSWECGGSLISESFVLTASHCLESPFSGPAIRVMAGTTSLNDTESEYQVRGVSERIAHPGYKAPARYDDIGLLRLEEPFELNGYVRPACLEQLSQPPGKSAIACGFGKTDYENEQGSNELLKVSLNYISDQVCQKAYKSDIGTKYLPSGFIPNMMCAGIMKGGHDTCQGDSGGPLQRVLVSPFCMYSIVGVTNFGKICGFDHSPGVYAKVSTYLDWIENIVWPE